MKFYFLFILFVTSNALVSNNLDNHSELNNKQPERVLFVGNSYLYYNDSLHNHVRRMVEETFPNKIDSLEFKSATIGGSRLAHHNIDHLLEHKNIAVSKPFQLVILQGGSGEALSEESRKEFSIQAERLINKIHASGADAALYMTHAYVLPHDDYDPGMIKKIKSIYTKAGQNNSSLVLPVGIAYINAYKERPEIILHKTFDGTHPDLLGTYLSACVLFASIYKKSPIGLKYNYFDSITKTDKDFLQKIAHDTVESFLDITLEQL